MPSHQPNKHAGAWRSRREEYLRASGRQSDLVKEGFEQASRANWAVIAGGRRTRRTKRNRKAGLLLVKNVAW